jgi:hypothetical protein
MSSKKAIWESAQKILTENNASEKLVKALAEILEPQRGGSVNLAEITKTDAEGNITEIMCSVSGVFLPANELNFFNDKQGVGGFRRASRQASVIKREFDKVTKASKDAIVADMLEGVIDNNSAKHKLGKLDAKTPDYSAVTPVKA